MLFSINLKVRVGAVPSVSCCRCSRFEGKGKEGEAGDILSSKGRSPAHSIVRRGEAEGKQNVKARRRIKDKA